jgi:hypothetical protein
MTRINPRHQSGLDADAQARSRLLARSEPRDRDSALPQRSAGADAQTLSGDVAGMLESAVCRVAVLLALLRGH